MPQPTDWSEKRTRWTQVDVADSYDAKRFRTRLQQRKHANDVRLVSALLSQIGENLRVLDAPTGTGRMIAPLEQCGHRLTGMDLSHSMLRQRVVEPTQSRPQLVLGDIEKMPFATNGFDAVVSLRFLFHAEDREVRIGLMTHFARVAPWLIGHVRHGRNLKHAGRSLRHRLGLTQRYRRAASSRELQEELGEAGFELVRRVPVSRLFSDKMLFLARRKA